MSIRRTIRWNATKSFTEFTIPWNSLELFNTFHMTLPKSNHKYKLEGLKLKNMFLITTFQKQIGWSNTNFCNYYFSELGRNYLPEVFYRKSYS